MAKRTRKYVEACKVFPQGKFYENDELYPVLEQLGFIWDSSDGRWFDKVSLSRVRQSDKFAREVYELRIKAHVNDIDGILYQNYQRKDIEVISRSKTYINRGMEQCTVYLKVRAR